LNDTLFPRRGLAVLALAATLSGCVTDGGGSVSTSASPATSPRPALVVTSDAAPEVVFNAGSRDTLPADDKVAVPSFSGSGGTLVARKVSDLGRDLENSQSAVENFRSRLTTLQSECDARASEYYGLIAQIATELQSGTTAGNPMLTQRWNDAKSKLDALSQAAGGLGALSSDISAEASKASFLQETVRATYGLSGAMKEDRKALQSLEDRVNENIVAINRLLTATGDETGRRTSTLRAENLNLQTLSLAIANGELYGQNMTNSLFKKAASDAGAFVKGGAAVAAPSQRRPLAVIRFNRPGVEYKQAVYTAVSQALEKYPAARFELVAVATSEGNPAEAALASTEARKNGEDVLRALTQMGVPMERITLSAASSRNVVNSEVHLFLQ
jgi:hypothetical protein